MNLETYIFGNFGKGYTQYPPEKDSEIIFKKFYQESKAPTQITIHRKDSLMLYGYVRKLKYNEYIGLCIIVNGVLITDISNLFKTFEEIIEEMVYCSYLIHIDDKGNICPKVNKLHEKTDEIEIIKSIIRVKFEKLEHKDLPEFLASNTSSTFSYKETENDIIESSYKNDYTIIQKNEGNTQMMNSYEKNIHKKTEKIKELGAKVSELESEKRSLKHQQRNTLWVSIVSIIAIILFGIIYVKVINPSEVTKKDMGEYMYYGPIDNGEPNGTGVAIYHDDDKDGRLYYYGNFENGKRIDKNAIMFYKDGSYFKGTMNEDKWIKGLFFDVEKEHFIGEFKKNSPWNGDWYKHVKVQTIVNGE